MVLQTAFNVVDTYFVARLGPKPLAAMGLTFPMFMMLISLGAGLSIGISSLVARSIGEGDIHKASNSSTHGILLAALLGLLVGITGYFYSERALELMGATGELADMAMSYLKILFVGALFKYVFFAYDGVFRGEGKTKLSMYALMTATVVNIVLDPLLIFGIGPFPRLEIAGAALATVISWAIGILVSVTLIMLKKSSLNVVIREFIFNKKYFVDIIKVGLPTAISQGMFALSMGFFNNFALRFNQFVVATYGLGFRIDGIAVIPSFAISSSTIAMIGQNYGAKKISRLKEIVREANLLVVIVMGFVGIIIFAFPQYIIGAFAHGEGAQEVIEYGKVYLRVVTIAYPLLGIGFISNSSFQGIGNGTIPLLNVLFRLVVISVPLAYFLAFVVGLGPLGLWLGMAISNSVFGILGYSLFRFRLGSMEKQLSKTLTHGGETN
jgi:putative MATE family efflux protein